MVEVRQALTTILLVILVSYVACAARGAITTAVVGEIQCVEAEIAKGDDTFEGIALACAPLAVEDVVTIVAALAASTSSPAAPLASKVHHAARGEQPKPGGVRP